MLPKSRTSLSQMEWARKWPRTTAPRSHRCQRSSRLWEHRVGWYMGHGWNFLGQLSINKCALDLLFKHYTQIYTSARATLFEQKLRMGADKWIRVNSLCASVLCLVRCGVTLYTLVFSRMRYHCVRFVLKCRTTSSLLLNQQLTQTRSSRNFSKIGPAPKPLWAQSGRTWKQCLENVLKKQKSFYWGRGGALL